MQLSKIIDELDLQVLNKAQMEHEVPIAHGYACDLLSLVLSKVQADSIWLTIQNHMNIIGVASMAGIPAVVICEGLTVEESVIEKADEEKIALFSSPESAFTLSGKLYESGIR